VSLVDADHDGDLDLIHVLGGALPLDAYHRALFQNPGFGHRWLRLKLEGVRSNRSAIGAVVRVVFREPAGPRTLVRTVGSGGSFGGNPLTLHLGLGDAQRIEQVEIEWPAAGRTQTVPGLELDRAYRVWEAETRAERVE
jgi:ASPIC and UnbV